MFKTDDIILDKYRIEKLLSDKGGMADIYLARNITIGRKVAIKKIKESLRKDRNLVERFKLEAIAQGNIDHPGIVNVFDYDVDSLSIVMEYVKGKELSEFIDADLKTKIEHCINALDALASAHEMGIVHRDLKPSNILITDKGFVKITDFGIAKIIGEENSQMTLMGVGTPPYMSPEQIKGEEITERTDIYSFGILMFYMVSKTLPFKGKTQQMTTMMHLQSKPPRFNELGLTGIPADLENIIFKCIEKDPQNRYASARDLKTDLEKVYQTILTDASPTKSGSKKKLMVAASLIIICIAGGYLLMNKPEQPPPISGAHPSIAVKPAITTKPSFKTISDLLAGLGSQQQADYFRLRTSKSVYSIGDTIAYQFEAEKPCYPVVIGFTTNGELVQIFPNAFTNDQLINAKEKYVVPTQAMGFELEVTGPSGTEIILAVVSEKPFELFPAKPSEVFYSVGKHDQAYLDELYQRIIACEKLELAQTRMSYLIKD